MNWILERLNAKSKNLSNQVALMTKSNNQIIQEIHDTFHSEVDRLLSEAKISVSEETTLSDLIEKANRLRALGFGATKECQDADTEVARIQEAQRVNGEKRKLASAINYFSQKYPLYKFITEDSVKKICKKYNLIYGPVSRYKGTVPDKNLKQMESFKIDESDACAFITKSRFDYDFREITATTYYPGSKITEDELEKIRRHNENVDSYMARLEITSFPRHWTDSVTSRAEFCPMEIAAPVSDFDTKGMELKDFQLSPIHIPDPIVLKPVYHGGQKHYLIVTAWGLEASDELVVNQKMN